MKDIHDKIEVVTLIAPGIIDADNTPAAVDRINWEATEILIHVGVGGITFSSSNKVEFKLTHSDDDSTYVAVASVDLVGAPTVGTGGIIKSLVAEHAAAANYQYGYIGNKRYLKLLADFSGTHGVGTEIGAFAIKGRPHHAS